MSEEDTPQPEDPYGIAKYAVELDLKAAHEMFGLDYTIFRPHNVYGPHQNIGDKYRNVIGIFMNQLMKDEPLTIFGDGGQKRAFSYIDDVAPHIADAPFMGYATKGETFNIGSSEPCSIADLALLVCDAFGRVPEVRYLPARNEVEEAYCYHNKAAAVFGDKLVCPMSLGLHRMAAWAMKQGPRPTPPFANIEIARNLPAGWEV